MSNNFNHYELLEMAESVTGGDIKRAFHRLSKKYHPDRGSGHLSSLKEDAE